MAEEELEFVDGLRRTRSSCICMTCQYFSYLCDQHCHTLLTCDLQRRQSSGSTRRPPDPEVQQLDGPQGIGNGLVPGGGVMREGWLIDANDHWVWRYHWDNSAWVRDPKVFLDRWRLLPDSPLA